MSIPEDVMGLRTDAFYRSQVVTHVSVSEQSVVGSADKARSIETDIVDTLLRRGVYANARVEIDSVRDIADARVEIADSTYDKRRIALDVLATLAEAQTYELRATLTSREVVRTGVSSRADEQPFDVLAFLDS